MNEELIRIETSMQLISLDVDPETLRIEKYRNQVNFAQMIGARLDVRNPVLNIWMVDFEVNDDRPLLEEDVSKIIALKLKVAIDPDWSVRKKERIDKLIDSMNLELA